MHLSQLSEKDRRIILQCLNAVSRGRFLENEHQTRTGFGPKEISKIATEFSDLTDLNSPDLILAVNNALNEVCHGIRFTNEEWQQWFDATRAEILEVYRKWRKL